MLVTASLAALFGLGTGALVYFRRVTAGAATLLWLSGFTAASTGLAGPVNDLLTAAVHAISSH
ncbi:hypothetical protein GCM10010441_38440 [Kitasatospora paracochleata]|uniref:Uncharacterized protein n=1 Tax=Kitasatospora paracochleata TaxID=58354 RepID=A0ABT1IQP0_9ACTN|nr:hypothetical protein [Kitasatospora paracochleata]MCP2306926.1 hypothetical protein [Kitasatospora paracochleata]